MSTARRILLVTGLSGAGKSSILRILEDIGYEVTDNPPLTLLDALAARTEHPIAIGIDVRTRGFEARAVLLALAQLRTQSDLHVELLYATAETDILLRRFTATRRRHPLDNSSGSAPGLVASIEQEIALLAPLRDAADLVIDTSDLPPPDLRRLIGSRFGHQNDGDSMTVTLLSFAYPAGLPREADLVFDARFLRNPHYDPALKTLTGLDQAVRDYVAEDPDYRIFFTRIMELLELVLPRFVSEGKKHATVAIGCSGGQHRSVTLVEEIAASLSQSDDIKLLSDVPIVVMHRELARQGRSSWRWARAPQQRVTPDEQIRTEPS
ncbi:RNase adapter RapZ [Asaia lannensis]|uniref:RNase adapter RapZ n=1 Tax=Asaia lannensis NBRC 102526 TaxID=1307926 RepID=A0ABT1CDC9_9PROT|nr:RNase adapter RapZ [Asaia lannensis]MCO6158869.1 RNase adapter RapZ [Asaia lannensis NBRC 102526]GBR00025.1 ATPase [Asaia lannensis NBRC 102526]